MYAYLTYAVLGLIYSMVNVPYGSLATAMTQVSRRAGQAGRRSRSGRRSRRPAAHVHHRPADPEHRRRTPALSADERADQLQTVFLTTTLAFVALGFALYFLTFLWCKEVVVRIEPRVGIKDTFRTLKSNKPLGILCASSFFYLIGLFAVGGATAFYAIYVLGDAKYIIWMTLVTRGRAIRCRTLCALRWSTRFGKKNLYQYCGLFTVVGGVALFFVPANLPLLALLCVAVKGFGVQLINTLMFALEADTVEYGEWKTGQRTEGATYAIFSFTRKITQSIGGALGAFALAIGGYVTKLAAGRGPAGQRHHRHQGLHRPGPGGGGDPGDAGLHRLPADREEVPRHRRRERRP